VLIVVGILALTGHKNHWAGAIAFAAICIVAAALLLWLAIFAMSSVRVTESEMRVCTMSRVHHLKKSDIASIDVVQAGSSSHRRALPKVRLHNGRSVSLLALSWSRSRQRSMRSWTRERQQQALTEIRSQLGVPGADYGDSTGGGPIGS
jgi:hypothetical protein